MQYSEVTLVDLLIHQASKCGDRTLYNYLSDDQANSYSLSYADLDHKARSIAALLQSLNAAGERALLLYPSNLDFIAGFFGALYAGVIAVPAYPPRKNQNTDRLRAIIRDSDTRYVLASSQVMRIAQPLLEEIDGLSDLTFIATDQLPEEIAQNWKASEINTDSLAFLQYTSGSTGDPKGVMLSHGNLLYNQEMIRQGVANCLPGKYVSWLPLFHDMGLGTVLQVLYRGSEGCLMSPATFIQRPQRWLWAISDTRAAISGGPNFAYDLCVKTFKPELYKGLDLSSWQVAFNGAEPIKTSTLEAFSKTFAPYGFVSNAFQPCYGLAEATVGVSSGDGGAVITKAVSLEALKEHRVLDVPHGPDDVKQVVACGHSWLEDEILIVNPETCREVKPSQVGEIWINSPSVGAGYWRRPEISQEVFRAVLAENEGPHGKHYLRTGDLGFLADGQLYVTGRLKELLIIRGRNYYPTDIEQCAANVDKAIVENGIAAFTVEQNNEEHLVLVCEIERTHLRSFDAEALSHRLCQQVAEQFELRVESVVYVKPGRIPKTSSGKIQRGLCNIQFYRRHLEAIAAWVGPTLTSLAPRVSPVKRVKVSRVADVSTKSKPVTSKKEITVTDAESEEIKNWLVTWFADQLDLPEAMISPSKNLASLGVDSLLVMRTSGELSHLLGCELPADLLWDFPTIDQLSGVLLKQKTLQLGHIKPWLDIHCDHEIAYPASAAQRRHWMLHQFSHLRTAYNLNAAYHVCGELNVEALRLGFQKLVHRHSALRTVFSSSDGELKQHILPAGSFLLQVEDWSNFSELQRESKLALLFQEESRYQFDLSKGPLYRTRLLRLAAHQYILYLNIHHIIVDGWSVEHLLRELSESYANTVSGKTADLASEHQSALQYVDYLHWQQEQHFSQADKKHLDYWAKKLESSPILALRTDFSRSNEPSGAGEHFHFTIPATLERAMRELCVREAVTLYHLLLASLSLLLSRYSRQEDICIGTPVANRSHRDLSQVVGVFVNTLVMRSNLAGNPTFYELLKRVKKTAQEAFNHQEFPFDQLVNHLGAGGDISQSPLFQVMLVVQGFALEESLELGELEVESITLESSTAKFDLSFEFRQQAEGLHGVVEYRSDLFKAQSIELMVTHYLELLKQITIASQAPIDSISMVPKEEQYNLLKLANSENRCPSPDHTLTEVFEKQVGQRANATALRFLEKSISYRQLNKRANQLAHYLCDYGIQRGNLVGLSMERSLDLIISMLAILKTGAAYVPVDTQSPMKRTQAILEDAGVRALISHTDRRENLPSDIDSIFVDELDLASYPDTNYLCDSSIDDTAYVIYTSGTTGKPKGVVVTHRNVVRLFSETDNWFHFNEKDVWTLFHSYGFDFSVWEIWGALLYGGRLVIVPHWITRSPRQFVELLVTEQVTVLNQTPAAFYFLQKEILKSKSYSSLTLKRIIFGGDLLELKKLKPWINAFGLDKPQLINMYGITETTVHVTYHHIKKEDFENSVSPIGRPIPDNQLYLLDSSQNLCPLGVPGEIYVGGGGVTKGYLHQPELNKERFVNNPFSNKKGEKLYRSGDLAYYDNEGVLCYLGRIDQQVKVRGYRIELGDIESCLLHYQADENINISVKSSIVQALADHEGELQLIAFIVPDKLALSSDDEIEFTKSLRAHVSKYLPVFMMPARFIFIDELPLTINGKLDVNKLLQIAKESIQRVGLNKPETEIEKYIAELWKQILCIEQVGLDDSFFDLGGHSLLATQVLNLVKDKYDIEVPISEFFQRPSVRQLAKYIDTVESIRKESLQKQANDDEDRQEFEL